MGYTRQDLESKFRLQFNMVGGYPTYFIDGQPVCFAYLSREGAEDEYCSYPAGRDTQHKGKGRCKLHDVNEKALDRRLKHGRYAIKTQERFKAEIEDFLADPEMMRLEPELALLRFLLTRNWVKYQEGDEEKEEPIRGLIAEITKMLERMEKISSNQVMTASNAKYLMIRALDVIQSLFTKWFSLEEVYRLSQLSKEELENLSQERLREFFLMWRKEVEGKISGAEQP